MHQIRFSLSALTPLFVWLTLFLAGSVGCDPNPPRRIAGTGGAPGSGGQTATGGITGTGGSEATGGAVGSGGTVGSGGDVGSGGTADEGGSVGSGGAAGPGGETASGGAAAGNNGGPGGGGRGGAGARGGTQGAGGASGDNLVTNGDFSMGEMSWKVDVSSITHSVVDGSECLKVSGGAPAFFLGWPAAIANALNLKGGTPYKLSYRASSTGPLMVKVEAKVGKAVDPFTDDLPLVTDTVTTAIQTFTHTFTPAATDTQAGVAFKISADTTASQMTTVCFDDVVLAKQ